MHYFAVAAIRVTLLIAFPARSLWLVRLLT
jgi:hypothetical protein